MQTSGCLHKPILLVSRSWNVIFFNCFEVAGDIKCDIMSMHGGGGGRGGFPRNVSTVLLIPFRLVRLPLSLVSRVIHLVGYPIISQRYTSLSRDRGEYALPVSGLDESRAQSIYFALQRAAATPREEHIVYTWIQALQVAQIASGRVLYQLATVDANLKFWTRRLEKGGHFWFALLRRGPLAFAERAVYLLKRVFGDQTTHGGHRNQHIDAEAVEARVLLFGVLRSDLCEALAEIQEAAASLHLKGEGIIDDGLGDTADSDFDFRRHDGASSAHTHLAEENTLFRKTEHAVRKSMVTIIDALEEFQTKADDVLKAQTLAQRPDNETDRALFSQTLLKALGMNKLKKFWGQQGADASLLSPQTSMLSRQVSLMMDEDADEYLTRKAKKVVGFYSKDADEALDSITVHDALKAAHASCRRLQKTDPLINIPSWMLMPTPVQQHWVKYTFIMVGCAYGGSFIIKHSPLCGSKDLEEWMRSGLRAVQSAWSAHVIEPLENLQGELFNTFRRRPSIVSIDEYEADRDSLKRMLQEFKVDVHKKSKIPPALRTPAKKVEAQEDTLLEGMELMMHCYENELKRPLKNLVAGDLMRSLLIQVQKMKVDTESAMLEIDQILKANELSISLVAAVPAFIIGGACLYTFGKILTPSPPDPRREASRSRLAMIDVERSLEFLVPAESQSSTEYPTLEQIGNFWFRLAVAFDETEMLFYRHSKGILGRSTTNEEWIRLRSDLLALAAPVSPEVKLRSAARMLRAYSIYQR